MAAETVPVDQVEVAEALFVMYHENDRMSLVDARNKTIESLRILNVPVVKGTALADAAIKAYNGEDF